MNSIDPTGFKIPYVASQNGIYFMNAILRCMERNEVHAVAWLVEELGYGSETRGFISR
jgi:hypothetical protein